MSGSQPGVSAERGSRCRRRTQSRVDSACCEFDDGAPSEQTAALLYDHLDFVHGVEAFLGALPGASLAAVRRGFLSMGIDDNSFSLFPELMDSASVFLTANCDTVYFWGFVDLTDGPMVIDVPSIDTPSGILGTVDDMWFRWVTDLGLPGPDRGQGGRYLMVGPGYDGPLPDSGFHVSHVRTTRVTVIGRAFMVDNDPKIPMEAIREGFRVSRYVPGTYGTAVGSFLAGASAARSTGTSARNALSRDRASRSTPSTRTTSDTGSSCTSWCRKNHRKPSIPICSACSQTSGSRTASRSRRTRGCARCSKTRSWSATPPPVPSRSRPDPRKASSSTRTRSGAARFRRRLPVPRPAAADHRRRSGRGPERWCPQTQRPHELLLHGDRHHPGDVHEPHRYRLAIHLRDARQRRHLPRRCPQLSPDASSRRSQSRFWSLLLYDRQTRSMLQTDQHLPRLGSQSGTVETNPDGSIDIYFGPTAPEGKADNWLQTVPGKGWWTILRLYNPLQPFFDKTWRPGEIEPI